MILSELHREIHFLEASVGKTVKELDRKNRQLLKLRTKLLYQNMIDAKRKETKETTQREEEEHDPRN